MSDISEKLFISPSKATPPAKGEGLICPEANQIFYDETGIEISIRIDRALRKIITQAYEEGRREAIEEIWNAGIDGEMYNPRKSMNYLERILNALKGK